MKKSQTKLLPVIYGAVILATFSSCYLPIYTDPYIVDPSRQKQNYYYAPTSPTVPMLTEKNDISFTMNGVVGDNTKGGSVHGAYKPIKNLGLLASYSWLKNDVGSGDIGRFINYEAGAGYVAKLSPYWHVEAYSGIGNGKVDNIHHTGGSKIKTNSFFLQPAIAVSDKKQLFQFGFFSKFSWTKFNLVDTSFNNDREQLVTQQMMIIHDNPNQVFWEPGFVARFGWRMAQFNASYSFSSDLTNKDMYRKKGLFVLGVVLRINTRELKTK